MLAVLIGLLASICCFIYGIVLLDRGDSLAGGVLLTVGLLSMTALCVLFAGFKVLAPNQAYVFTLFGKYYGTLKSSGFYFVNPFVSANAPAAMSGEAIGPAMAKSEKTGSYTYTAGKPKKISP